MWYERVILSPKLETKVRLLYRVSNQIYLQKREGKGNWSRIFSSLCQLHVSEIWHNLWEIHADTLSKSKNKKDQKGKEPRKCSWYQWFHFGGYTRWIFTILQITIIRRQQIGVVQKGHHRKNGNVWTPLPPCHHQSQFQGTPLPPCHRVNSDKLSLRIQVTKTIFRHFKNSNDTRDYDKSAKFLK